MPVRVTLALAMVAASLHIAAAADIDDCRQARRSEARLAACSKVIDSSATSEDDKANAYRLRAEARADAGAINEAIADYTRSLLIRPRQVSALSGRGLARLAAGDLVGALGDHDDAIRLSPASAALYVARGHIHLTMGNIDAAIADTSEALRLNPRNVVALNNRGLAYRRKGDAERAEADFTAALATNPIYALAYANRGVVREAVGRKAEAIEDYRQALLLDASLADAREGLRRLAASDASMVEADRRVTEGQGIAEASCSKCHAVGRSGASPNAKAPEFRNISMRHPQLALREPLTRGIAAPHDEMPRFAFATDQIDALVAYISSLSPTR